MPCPCQLCPAPDATVHLTALGPTGEREELHLCRACVARTGLRLDDPPPLAKLREQRAPAAGEAEATPEVVDVTAPAPGEDACPTCGLEFTAYVQSNLFGCSECYQAFAPQVEELAKRYHGAVQHVGRLPPAGTPVAVQRASMRAALEQALSEAIAGEQFERAAELRDQLKGLA